MKSLFSTIHKKLLPADCEQGVLPYVWLVYLGIFVFPIFLKDVPLWGILATLGSTFTFLCLYFFAFWQNERGTLFCILAILILGMISASFNPGASVFFVYAAAFCSQLKPQKKAKAMVVFIAASAGIFGLVLSMPLYFILPGVVFSLLLGGVNIYEDEIRNKNKQLKVSQEELQKAAETAERERIARDLHDVIGHTFSLITIKAQVAQKLVTKDTLRAQQELKELEQISRDAMSEVRATVTRYQTKDMLSEISKAKILTQSADIKLTCHTAPLPENEKVNSTLAFVIRELMTNLVKHANADQCELKYERTDSKHLLSISDNGRILKDSNICEEMAIREGNGLRGIKERVAALGGDVSFRINKGFTAIIEVPSNA